MGEKPIEKQILKKLEPEPNDSYDKPPKKIFEQPDKKTVDSSLPSKNPMNQIKKPMNEPEKKPLETKKPIFEVKKPYMPEQPAYEGKKPYMADLQKPYLESNLAKNESQKPYLEPNLGKNINPNLKPSNNKMILKFDDDEDEEDINKEEEKLPNFGGGFKEKETIMNTKPQNVETNKFSFATKPKEVPMKTTEKQEEEDEEEDFYLLPVVEKKTNVENKNNPEKEDKEMEYLDKILNLEKNLEKKNDQISELMRKMEDLEKKNEEYKQMAYKANKDNNAVSKNLQGDFEKMKLMLKDSEEKKQAFLEEIRQLTNKLKKLEMDYKNVFY